MLDDVGFGSLEFCRMNHASLFTIILWMGVVRRTLDVSILIFSFLKMSLRKIYLSKFDGKISQVIDRIEKKLIYRMGFRSPHVKLLTETYVSTFSRIHSRTWGNSYRWLSGVDIYRGKSRVFHRGAWMETQGTYILNTTVCSDIN